MAYIKASSEIYYMEGRRSKNEVAQFISSGHFTEPKKYISNIRNYILAPHMASVEDKEREGLKLNSHSQVKVKVFELDDDSFESSTSTGIWLVLFYSSNPSTCPDCQQAKKLFDSIALESKGFYYCFYFYLI